MHINFYTGAIKELELELKALEINVLSNRQIQGAMYMGMRKIQKEAKRNARKIKTDPKQGKSRSLKFRRELANAIGFKKTSSKSLKVLLGVITPRTLQSKHVKVVGALRSKAIHIDGKGFPGNIALLQELGTKQRQGKRGRIRPSFFMYRAFKSKRAEAMETTGKQIEKLILKWNMKFRFLHYRMSRGQSVKHKQAA